MIPGNAFHHVIKQADVQTLLYPTCPFRSFLVFFISQILTVIFYMFFQPLPYLSFTLQNAPINLPSPKCHHQKSTDLIHTSLPHIWKLPSWNSVLNSLSWLISEFPGFFPKPSWLHYFSISIARSTASVWPENSVLFSFLLPLSSFFLGYMVFVITYVLIKQNLNSHSSLLVLAFAFECFSGSLNLMSPKLNSSSSQ